MKKRQADGLVFFCASIEQGNVMNRLSSHDIRGIISVDSLILYRIGGVNMEKILLAVDFRQLEDYLEKELKKEYLFVGATVYREGVIRSIAQKKPDILVIRETLKGKENILSLLYEIRSTFPRLRVIFIAGKREPGDALLASLVNYGIYDVVYGEKIQAKNVATLVRRPNEYRDVKELQPVPVLDEGKNQIIFQSPKPIIKEKEVIREVYIDKEDNVPLGERQVESSEPLEGNNFILDADIEPVPTTHQEDKPNFKANFFEKIINKQEKEQASISRVINTNTKQKIITFMGGKQGVGNTTVALNTAVELAKTGANVIYLEFDDKTPAVNYWYELGFIEDGIDSALKGLADEDYDKVGEAIIRMSEMRKKESVMQGNYKKFPSSLDFMFYSQSYLSRTKEELDTEVNFSLSKELFLYLMFQMHYDVVILDVPPDIYHPITANALIYSHHVFLTLTQDVASIGYALYKMNELNKSGLHMDSKLTYLLNKYEQSQLSLKEVKSWIEIKELITVPLMNKECINANFVGLPVALNSKKSDMKASLKRILTTLQNN